MLERIFQSENYNNKYKTDVPKLKLLSGLDLYIPKASPENWDKMASRLCIITRDSKCKTI